MNKEKSICGIAEEDQAAAVTSRLEESASGRVPLEAWEFESLLERASEILSIREHSAT